MNMGTVVSSTELRMQRLRHIALKKIEAAEVRFVESVTTRGAMSQFDAMRAVEAQRPAVMVSLEAALAEIRTVITTEEAIN